MKQISFLAVLALLVSSCLSQTYDLGRLQLEITPGQPLRLFSTPGLQLGNKKNFEAKLGVNFPPEELSKAQVSLSDDGKVSKVQIGANARVDIDYPNPECVRFTTVTDAFPEIVDCTSYGTADWYGGPQQRVQLWPVQKLVFSDYTYVTKSDDFAALTERLWINSEGVYLYVTPEVPLFISSNATGENDLCFIAKFSEPYIQTGSLTSRFSICSLQDPRSAQQHAITVSRTGVLPRALPDSRMIQHPIWSTWARYKTDINEAIVLEFANEINNNGFLNSQLEIDDDWETCYGELVFDSVKFPNPANLVQTLKSMGFRVTLWIHPFVNANCPSFDAWRQAGYFVTDADGNVKTQWWNGQDSAIVDFTNPAASLWFVNRLVQLKSITGIDGYKFDAGETSWMPPNRILPNVDPSLQPNIYSAAYVRALDVPELGRLTEVRSGFETQDLPIFVRMIDKDTRWSMDGGLPTVVTTLLNMNMAGYFYVLPDMIGGNGYGSDVITSELFIRWLQASVFMPSLQFSFVPWQFNDPNVVTISKKFVQLHADLLQDILIAMDTAMTDGLPVNRPVFYATPYSDDLTVFRIEDEYMLGENLLIAPVLEEGAVSRDIYLPQGNWIDLNTLDVYNGSTWIYDYPAPLDILPYFRRVNNSASSVTVSYLVFMMSTILYIVHLM